MTDSTEMATNPKSTKSKNSIPRYKFKSNKNLNVNLYREITGNRSFSFWWILEKLHFQWKVSRRASFSLPLYLSLSLSPPCSPPHCSAAHTHTHTHTLTPDGESAGEHTAVCEHMCVCNTTTCRNTLQHTAPIYHTKQSVCCKGLFL